MAFATQSRSATSGLKLDLSAAVYALITRISDYRAYRRTLVELSALNDRELADLGLNRASLRSIAHSSVYGKRA